MLNHPWRTYCLWWTEEPLLSFRMGHNEPMTLEALLGVFSDCTIQIVTQLYQMLTAVKHYGRLEILKEKIRNSQSRVAQDMKRLLSCYTHTVCLRSLPSTGIHFFSAFPD